MDTFIPVIGITNIPVFLCELQIQKSSEIKRINSDALTAFFVILPKTRKPHNEQYGAHNIHFILMYNFAPTNFHSYKITCELFPFTT